MKNTYNISEAAELIGVSVKTLQRWDREGKLVASRTPSNRRYYTKNQLSEFCDEEETVMYYVLNVDRFADAMSYKYDMDDKTLEKLWKKIISEEIGTSVDDGYYIFTTKESFEIDGFVIDCSYPLEEWVGYQTYDDESVEIFEGWRLEYSDVLNTLLDYLYDDMMGDDEYSTYAEMIVNAEDPTKKVHELLTKMVDVVFDLKLQEMKWEMEKFTEKLKSGKIKWN